MKTPEEKLANRLIKKHNLIPPFILLNLVSLYAIVKELQFPIAGDGITVGLGGSSTPLIIINSDQVKTRKNFTLAHELGHVIIPWHTGTILSDESDLIQGELEYRQMESEANRFAAELLMPSDWVIDTYENAITIEAFFKKIINDSCVSREAALIKIFNVIEKPIICIETHCDGRIIKKYNAKNCALPSFDFLNGYLDQELINNNIKINFQYEYFNLSDKLIHTYLFEKEEFMCSDKREWREILDDIVSAANSSDSHWLKQSINATLASRYQKYKSSCEIQELCSNILMGFCGVKKYEGVYNNPMIKDYIHIRVSELLEKDKNI